jgi:hypothetical protein
MPLTHETELRISLDSLFFKDTILRKLKAIRPTGLEAHFPRSNGQTTEEYRDKIVDFISEHFVGYSISHVDGRFRAEGIRDYDAVAKLLKGGRRYLIDETTAVTRFIFPYENNGELEAVRFLFHELFVRSMIGLAEGESEVWMLESGTEQCVHIWRAEDGEVEEEDKGDESE